MTIPRGPSRRASAYEISKSTGFHVDFGFQNGFLDFKADFWIHLGSIVLDGPSALRSQEAIQLLQATPTCLVTCHVTQGSAAPQMSSCTCAMLMHGLVMAGAAPREKQSNQSYEDEHLRSWPVYVWRCGPADWLVSEQRPPSHEQDLSCMQSTNEHANPQ